MPYLRAASLYFNLAASFHSVAKLVDVTDVSGLDVSLEGNAALEWTKRCFQRIEVLGTGCQVRRDVRFLWV